MKRRTEPQWLQDYKWHIDQLAAVLLGNRERWISVTYAVKSAREIIDEVDKQVDGELEQSKYQVDYKGDDEEL